MIPRETLDHIGDAATEFPLLDEATLDCLRDRWPGLHFALCSAGPASTSIWSTAASIA